MIARALIALLALAGAGGAEAQQPQRVAPTERSQIVYSYAPIVKRVTPAVVNVYAQRTEQRQARNPLFDDPFFRTILLRGIAWAAGESPYRFDSLILRGIPLKD